jgi:hypothetical protein
MCKVVVQYATLYIIHTPSHSAWYWFYPLPNKIPISPSFSPSHLRESPGVILIMYARPAPRGDRNRLKLYFPVQWNYYGVCVWMGVCGDV